MLLLTARGEIEDRVNGLAVGADDYLVKPFDPRELLLRIVTILRRAAPATPERAAALWSADLRSRALRRSSAANSRSSDRCRAVAAAAARGAARAGDQPLSAGRAQPDQWLGARGRYPDRAAAAQARAGAAPPRHLLTKRGEAMFSGLASQRAPKPCPSWCGRRGRAAQPVRPLAADRDPAAAILQAVLAYIFYERHGTL